MDLDIPAEISGTADPREEPKRAVIGNLGPDGAFVKTLGKFEQGARGQLAFKVESHPIGFVIDVEVRWVKDGGIGLQFHGVSAYDRSVLDDYCQRRYEESKGVGAGGGMAD